MACEHHGNRDVSCTPPQAMVTQSHFNIVITCTACWVEPRHSHTLRISHSDSGVERAHRQLQICCVACCGWHLDGMPTPRTVTLGFLQLILLLLLFLLLLFSLILQLLFRVRQPGPAAVLLLVGYINFPPNPMDEQL